VSVQAIPRINLTRARGDTYAEIFQLKQAGDPVDISADTFTLTLDTREDPSDSSTQFGSAWAGVIVDAGQGIFSLAPTLTDSNALVPGTPYFYDVQWVDGGGAGPKRTIIKGQLTVVQDITKA
jgi:hypothetical protein